MSVFNRDAKILVGPQTRTAITSWEYWHNCGACVKDDSVNGLYIEKVLCVHSDNAGDLLTNEDGAIVYIEGYNVGYTKVSDKKYPYATLLLQNMALPIAFLEKNFPGMLGVYRAGLAIGMDPAAIEDIWINKMQKNVTSITLPDLRLD